MTRTVFDNDMTAHVWAQQSQAAGRSSKGAVFFEGPALYSYGTHFLTAFILDGVAYHNSDSYSITTSKHQSRAAGASRHLPQVFLPALTSLRSALDAAARNPQIAKAKDGWPRRDFLAYLESNAGALASAMESNWRALDPQGLRRLARHFGFTDKQTDSALAKAARAAAVKAAAYAKASAAREAAARKDDARALVAMSDSEFRALFPKDADPEGGRRSGKSYEWRQVEAFGARLSRAHKAAPPSVKAKLWPRLKEWRAHVKGMPARLRAAYIAAKVAEFEAWKAAPDTVTRPRSWTYPAPPSEPGEGAADMAPLYAAFEALQAAENQANAAKLANDFALWQAGTVGRPYAGSYAEGSPERAAILASEAAERAEAAAAYRTWTADKSAPRPSSRLFLIGETVLGDKDSDRAAWSALVDAEQAEAEAARKAKAQAEAAERAAKMEAWLNGAPGPAPLRALPDGSAFIRRRGDMLETSQGADVPWSHAVRAFQFIKQCRETGKGFKSNGRTVRVGHFRVDSITAQGDMRAGCHSFNWSQIEALARRENVLDLAPSAEAVEASH